MRREKNGTIAGDNLFDDFADWFHGITNALKTGFTIWVAATTSALGAFTYR